jgi:hypothetical protein
MQNPEQRRAFRAQLEQELAQTMQAPERLGDFCQRIYRNGRAGEPLKPCLFTTGMDKGVPAPLSVGRVQILSTLPGFLILNDVE